MSSLFVNQLTTIDFSYLCPERGLVGETWLVDVVLSGALNDEGMVFDFGHVKKEIKAMIDGSADHALLVPTEHSAVTIQCEGEDFRVCFAMDSGDEIICQAPEAAILALPVPAITPEHVAPWLENYIVGQLPSNVDGITLRLYPEDITEAKLHYSHGLKKHAGDCQRIAHGHRSRLQIFVDGLRRDDLEQEQALLWKDIYLANREDLKGTYQHNGRLHNRFGYRASQGEFQLSLPANRCYLMDTDTTIELLTDHLLSTHVARDLGQSVRVVANEGFCKGSMAEHTSA